MVWNELTEGLTAALQAIGLHSPERIARLELAVPRDATHGDWTTNLALTLAKEAKRPPRAIAEALAAAFPNDPERFEPVEVAGPGFLNFRYSRRFLARLPARVLAERERFGRSESGAGVRVLVEYVSANPTGPLNVVSARAAAVGGALIRLLNATGYRAEGEFYVNDVGRQAELLALSVRARARELAGQGGEFPADGYQGEYVREIARALGPVGTTDDLDTIRERAIEWVLASQRRDLDAYGAEFSRWFRESELHRSGAVQATLAELVAREMTYRAAKPEPASADPARAAGDDDDVGRGDATFLRTSRFGDDLDRVIERSDGTPTYLLPDVAYHRDKHSRGFRHAINLWGPDHHGYVPRMKAALQALGVEPDFLEVLIVQQVNLLAGGQPVKMSKRAGEFVTLRDLMDEVGADCAKFFFLLRSTSAHLDFDLDLAKRQNDENPAYYVQYAHARIASLLRFAAERDLTPSREAEARFEAPEELALIRKLAAFPELVRGAAAAREPHRVPAFLMETAAEFHRFYHVCRVVSEDRERSRDRLLLCDATRQVLANGLGLLGVAAPDRMERSVEVTS